MASNVTGEYVMCVTARTFALNYTRQLLEIEQNFDHCLAFTWLTANWKLCYIFIAAYLAVIFVSRKWMSRRRPFQLKWTLLVWNSALAFYSILAGWRMWTAIEYSVQRYGLFATSCTMGQPEQRQAIGLWLFAFIVSKIVEFGDTVFIVLRKSPLIFLHWYHHTSVAFFVWSSGDYASPMHNYFAILNLFVHSVMYSYYALKTIGTPVPKVISKAITTLQLLQMVAGIAVIGYMVHVKATDPTCQVPIQGLVIAITIYSSYFVLFLNFFIRNYCVGKAGFVSQSSKKLL